LKPASVSTKQERIAKLARENPAMVFTSLNHYLDVEWMEYAYECTRKDGAVGVVFGRVAMRIKRWKSYAAGSWSGGAIGWWRSTYGSFSIASQEPH
jgi:hypothetical protein